MKEQPKQNSGFVQCQMLEGSEIVKAEFIYKIWAKRLGEENRYIPVSKKWIENHPDLYVGHVDISPIDAEQDERYICHYKFEC